MYDYEKLGAFYLGKSFDPASGTIQPEVVLYDSRDLTTHAVIVGMTGSGKTGLGITLLEEAAIDGIPAIIIDPKGDMGNLLLSFPALQPADFRPWVEESDAARQGVSPDDYAAQTAESWRSGLAKWDQPPERVARFRQSADFAIYTPGSNAGLPISVLKSFDAPPAAVRDSADALRERVSTTVSGLLALLGIEADPLRSREHILLSNILDRAWQAGRNVDLAGLIREIQTPTVKQIGVLDLETFFPGPDRTQLAMLINNVLAAPAFAAWMQGEPLNVQRLLFTPEGKPRLSIVSIAHLADSDRMFFVTLLLNEVLGWMRSQPGTSSLRAILYMDEVFGYLPPTANPPSKTPLLTLLKQARAFGLGLVLATQNPVDLDYKALSNAGTWFLGRLQTERDKQRLLDGLEGVAAGGKFDRAAMERTISALGPRVFLLNNVHDNAHVVFQTRWALSYLRGPLTREQIGTLTAGRRPEVAADTPPPTATSVAAAAPAVVSVGVTADAVVPAGSHHPPVLPSEVKRAWLTVSRSTPRDAALTYHPALLARGRLHYVDAKSRSGVDVWINVARLCRLSEPVPRDPWEGSETVEFDKLELRDDPEVDVPFAAAPPEIAQAKSYRGWAAELKNHLYREERLRLYVSAADKTYSQPGETEGDFVARLHQGSREARDAAIEKLRAQYAAKIERLKERERRALQRIDVEKEQASQATVSAAMSFGQSLLGALFGRKLASAGNVSRAATSVRSAGRAAQQRGDIQRAQDDLQSVQAELHELEQEVQAEVDRIAAECSSAAGTPAPEPYLLSPRKSDITVGDVVLVWLPFRSTSEGTVPAWAPPQEAGTLATPTA